MRKYINYYLKKGTTVNKTAEKCKVSRATVISYAKFNNLPIIKDQKNSEHLKPIIKKLYRKGYSDSEIGKFLNLTRRYVCDIRKLYNISFIKPIKLTKREKSIIVGTLFGDAYIQTRSDKTSRLSLHHSIKQLEYCKWKAEELKKLEFSSYFSKQDYKGKKYKSVKFNSKTLPCLYEFSYQNKQIKEDWLKYFNSLSLSLMYMDDGCKMHKSYSISTNSFNKESLKLFNNHCKKLFNIEFLIHKDSRIYLPQKYAKKFTSLIKNYIHPSLKYKLHSQYL